MTNRRTILKGTLSLMLTATAMTTLAPLGVAAKAPQVKTAAPGYYRMMLGDFEITALSDGTAKFPAETLYIGAKDQIAGMLERAFLDSPVELSINAFLVNTNERLVMIDAGTGDFFGPTLGKLIPNLVAAGYQPEQIDDIILTHAHVDHLGGLVAGDRIVFPNATVHLNSRDADFWLSAANRDTAPEAKRDLFSAAVKALTPYRNAGRLKTFLDGAEPVPGFKSTLRAGHTPGHSAIAVESKGQKLVFWGDITHGDVVQFDEPYVTIGFDEDQAAAASARDAAFAEAVEERYLVAGAHTRFPGIGHVRTDSDNFDWVPLNYSATL
ncbi:glyoxylase-like metal-dependent hydrolase (beta-lactamase superfamily II) [Rhizobium azibense]|uniref:Glyoxylase-like metal-dependent hydrolase (Beta-lactamase superfamily II) n=1 Tax=Rhizobium azibense TaxID=1136135 RepID=A0A4V2V9W1_9HYPH|nr:MBL fold metallo-hydrolase [Rhizobium azibense]TCU18685.1 glyoxylase-like metal-dependent hydrolase (beta-lactamase superfamily II) [Rhizobium azibense]